MEEARLSPMGGEFVDRDRERAFLADRLDETRRHAKLLLSLSILLNTLFLVSDWRFFGQPHFPVAVGARLVVIAMSIGCYVAIRHVTVPVAASRILIAWQWVIATAIAFLVSSHSDIALFVVFLLPCIFYLAVPLPFRCTLAGGIGSSVLMLIGYLDPAQGWQSMVGLVLVVVVLNCALILVVARANRLGRLEWAATQAERKANAELRRSQDLLEKTFRSVPIPLVVTTLTDGRILKFSDAAVAYYGGSPEEHGIQTIGQVYKDPEIRDAFLSRLRNEGSLANFEAQILLADGSVRDVLLAATVLGDVEEPSLVAGVVDITERRAAEEQVRHAATHDALTGLLNRGGFQERFEVVVEEGARKGGACLLLVDLDGLKDVNDTLGHDAGDALLVETARRLNTLVGARGLVARLGGDEFVILLSAPSDLDVAKRLAHNIINDFRRPVPYVEHNIPARVSIGIAVCPDHDSAPGELMKDADLALYSAKQQGRNRAVVYTPSMRKAVLDRVGLAREVSAALSSGQIVPFYQPKISLVTGALVGFEALVRWRLGAYSVLGPADFDAALEVPDLAVMIGERITRQVASDARGWLESGYSFGRVAINLSPSQFSHRDLASTFLRVFQAAGVGPEHFEVEITETVFLGRGSDHVGLILDEFYKAGVRIALDDFGTGYAALTHLKKLPIDTIKIDQSFVRDIERDAYDTAIVCAVIELGKNLGMHVIAEGVETVGQARFLKERGCEYAQGFLYGRPMGAAEVVAFLREEGTKTAARRRAGLVGLSGTGSV